jgi:competence protein CoiA
VKFALVSGQKSKPTPKARGVCLHCGAEMVAKCGRAKVWHWAHKTREVCDPWWENETEWHRNWKSEFPEAWQEVSHIDSDTGERHVADVKASSGLVVEFQNSPMSQEEMHSRESFYGDMIWIVNGLRGDQDLSYFIMGLGREPIQNDPLAYPLEWWGRSRILHNWSFARARVFIDFGDSFTKGPPVVWRLAYFDREKKFGAVGPYPKQGLIEAIVKGNEIGVTYLQDASDEDSDRQGEGFQKEVDHE